jgi:hypothetical protein
MAPITPGQDSTFPGADSIEKHLFQNFRWWQLQEENKSINPLGEEYFTGTLKTDTNDKFFEGTWKIPAVFDPLLMTMTAGIIYQGLNFSPGTGGTFKNPSASGYTLEAILWAIQRQNDTSNFNPDNFEYITGRYDANIQMWEGTFKLPYQTTLLSNGGTQDIARSYLL